MTMRLASALLCTAAFALAACGEKPQTASAKKVDETAWAGSGYGNVAPGWKRGDQASWEQQMRDRARSQNEYDRLGASPRT